MNKQAKFIFYFKILFNILFWGVWIGLPMFSPVHHPHGEGHLNDHGIGEFSEHFLVEIGMVVPLFYWITLVLYPFIFKRKGIGNYLITIIFSMLLFWVFQNYIEGKLFTFDEGNLIVNLGNLYSLFVISSIATLYSLIIEYFELEQIKNEESSEKLKSELNFLRSQISPHFIFNVLNSIVYLIKVKNTKEAEEVTLKLSTLMRYMLYESDQTMIPMSNEKEYIQSYIELQKVRFQEDAQIDYKEDFSDFGEKIEPMLLIPFIENAFKHGINGAKNPFIKIELRLQDSRLFFMVKNSISHKKMVESKGNASGIGLKNVIRRLELLYPKKHQINLIDGPNSYTVELTIDLDKK